MANAKIDDNFKKTLTAVTDDANATITRLLVNPTTGRLLVSAIVTSGAGISSLGGITTSTQLFAVGSSGNQFNISSSGSTHTFNLPTASASGTGQLTGTDWTTFNNKLSTAITTLGGITTSTQLFAIGSLGNQFNISSAGSTHTFNLPTASASGTGQLTAADWTTFNNKLSSISGGDHSTLSKLSFALAGHTGFQETLLFNLPLSVSGTTLSITKATSSGSGYLISADWVTFNNKADYSFGANNFTGTGNFATSGSGSITSFSTGSLTSGTITANQGVQFNATAYYGAEFINGNSGTTGTTISWQRGNKQVITLTGSGTITMVMPPGPSNLLLRLVQDATSARTVVWSPLVKWSGGSILSTGSSAIDIASFYWPGSGGSVFGMLSTNFV